MSYAVKHGKPGVAVTLKELIEMAEREARRTFMRHGAISTPMCFAETPVGPIVFGEPPLPKDLANKVVRDLLAKKQASAYVFIAEAWMLTLGVHRGGGGQYVDECPQSPGQVRGRLHCRRNGRGRRAARQVHDHP